MKKLSLLLVFLLSVDAFASGATLKQIDNIQNSTGGSSLAVPGTGTTFLTDTSTATVTNKSLSGSSNTFTNIPVSAIATGTALGVTAGGTGLITATANGMLFGNGTSAFGITAAGSQYQVFQAGASGVPTVGALNLAQSAATTGQLPVAAGGTGLATLTSGAVILGAGTSTPTFVSPSTSGNVLTSNGSTWISSAPASSAPAQNGSQASPASITASGGITLTGLAYENDAFIAASTTGTTTVTATPSITACTAAGQKLYVTGESATKLVKLQDASALAGSALNLNGPWTSALNSILVLRCDGNGFWNEVTRTN